MSTKTYEKQWPRRMHSLPEHHEPPPRLGALQAMLYESVVSLAKAFDDAYEPLDPRRASCTLLNLLRANPGLDERQITRAAASLVRRGILKISPVGWSLGNMEYERLLRQRLKEAQGCEYT